MCMVQEPPHAQEGKGKEKARLSLLNCYGTSTYTAHSLTPQLPSHLFTTLLYMTTHTSKTHNHNERPFIAGPTHQHGTANSQKHAAGVHDLNHTSLAPASHTSTTPHNHVALVAAWRAGTDTLQRCTTPYKQPVW